MKRHMLLLTLLVTVVAACRPQNEVELTLVAQNVALNTQIAAVRETATVDADRLQVTVEYMNTLVAQAQEQRSQLQATLIARGTDASAVGVDITPGAPLPTPLPAADGVPDPAALVTPAPGDVAVTPFGADAAAAPSAASGLANIVTSTGVGNDDCAIGATSAFSTSSDRVYVVARAFNIQPGTTILSRWYREGQQVVTHDFAPDFAIEDACIWFFIDQTDATFTPGNWAVDLEINGAVVGPSTPFTISE